MMIEEPPSHLSDKQLARVDALKAARVVLVAKTIGGSSAADPIDLVSLAQYIENGEDPYGVTNEHATV